jgi:ABC-type branched-subunit amino acid transport system substrate-binding protein
MSITFFSTAAVFSPPFIAAAGAALDGTRFAVFTPSDERRYADFRDAFQKRYGTAPTLDIATVPSFDIANLIVNFTAEFKSEVGSSSYYDALKSFLLSVKYYDGASGTITIDSDGAPGLLHCERTRSGRARDISCPPRNKSKRLLRLVVLVMKTSSLHDPSYNYMIII